jgi:phage-related protein
MKPVRFLGDSLKAIQNFPATARRSAGHELQQLQLGFVPRDSKPMPSVGRGVEEIRLWDDAGTFRVIFMARVEAAVYVLHAFQKKTQQTNKRDIDLARRRYKQIGEIEG